SLRGKAPSVLPKNQPPSLYTGQKITMDFFKTDIHNVMRLFGEITGKNIVLDERVKGEVTISLKDVPWDQALEMILDANNLIKEEKNGVITIRPLPTEPAGQGVLISTPIPKERLGAVREWSREKAKEAQMFSLFYRAKVLEAEGDLRESFKTYEEVFRLMRSNESLMRANGWILEFLCEGAFKLGSLEKAYYYAKEALRVRGEEQWAAHVAAISAAMIGKETEAKIYFDMAMSMGDTNPDLLLNYGLFLENTGNGEGALGIYRRYEELMGPDLDVGLRVARLYKEAGDKQRACQKYKELITYSSAEEKGLTATIYENIKGTCGEGVVK
ncbi:MAG: secretin and TonB N-terminal domain-containing protein, partial [Desulfatiglandales bacterium]